MIDASGPRDWPYRLGKLPARPEAIRFSLASYIDLSLPQPPPYFSHRDPPPFHDFANSKYGSCVFAGAANETALWLHEAGSDVGFTTKDVLSDYAVVTGFDPKRPETDKGADLAAVSEYRRRIGIRDASGRRQRIDAYAKLELGDFDRLRTAMWLLGGVGVGFRFPAFAMAQFKKGEPWDVKRPSFWQKALRWLFGSRLLGDKIKGGHYVPAIGIRPNGNIMCVSWGKIQEMTPQFFLRYADEIICYLDLDRLDRVKKKSPEGFNSRQLMRDLGALASGQVYRLC